MQDITSESDYNVFFSNDFKYNKFSVLYFTAKWCGPCKRMYPMVTKIIDELNLNYLNFYKIDIDDNEEIVNEYDISGVPTFILLYNNEVLYSFSGCDVIKFKNLLLSAKNKYKDLNTINNKYNDRNGTNK